jgi:hypothetical protein
VFSELRVEEITITQKIGFQLFVNRTCQRWMSTHFCISMITNAVVLALNLIVRLSVTDISTCPEVIGGGFALACTSSSSSSFGSPQDDCERVRSTSPDGYSIQKDVDEWPYWTGVETNGVVILFRKFLGSWLGRDRAVVTQSKTVFDCLSQPYHHDQAREFIGREGDDRWGWIFLEWGCSTWNCGETMNDRQGLTCM